MCRTSLIQELQTFNQAEITSEDVEEKQVFREIKENKHLSDRETVESTLKSVGIPITVLC